ncbi:MAG: DeoR faimly transcriptional regulator [Peptococcaceae bacterium BRH_c4b]|nr:MAG: DeoR faimly transcriptional regulator [Peptococcaceae bacterium BRH_c4b]
MSNALELAARATGRTSPNPMVGAVLVKDGKIVGSGYHHRAGTPHAEVHALREAGGKARGATLYVTLEPCCHHGRTGPCTEAVIEAGVTRVVAAMTDPNPLVAGRGLDKLREAGIEAESGLLEKEARRLNEVFIKYITVRQPFVVLKAAMSLDGKIATRTGDSQWITGIESREYVHHLRDHYDAIMVGINTVLADNPSLTTRLPGGGGRDPVRIVLDSAARTPPEARVLRVESPAPTIIVTTTAAPAERLAVLEDAGARIITVDGDGGRVDLRVLMKKLAAMEICSVLVEGGGQVHASVLAAGVADKVIWFIAPKLIGGASAPGPVGGQGVERLAEAVSIRRVNVTRFGEDICVEGYIGSGVNN